MIKPAFYRGMGAYLVGRLFSGSHSIPLALALIHTPEGVVIDSALLDEDSVSILFSFAHSYFHVEVERPYDLVHFLKTMMPRKRTGELYISLGYHKHGKTELYRDLLDHLAYTQERFEIARGQRGMVMLVFTMPSYDIVLKLIKDHFNYPKDSTRKEVMAKYDLVYRQDRAGRLVDAQSFEYLEFSRDLFSEELLEALQRDCSQSVCIGEDTVVLAHAYFQRRVIPLDIFVREAREAAACAARSTRASRCSATQAMTASRIASLVGKWRNSAPCVRFMRFAIAAVVMSPGFCSAVSSTTASMVTARRCSAGKFLGFDSTCIANIPKDSN